MDIPLEQFKHLSHGHYIRGLIINEFSGLEKAIERYIVTYFLGQDDKGNQLSNIILDRLTFEAKRTAFKAILDDKEIKAGFKKTKNNKFIHNNFLNEIRRLNDHRNYFAHYIMVMPTIPTEHVIKLAEFRDNLKYQSYTNEQYEQLFNDIHKAIDQVEIYTQLL